ncbi:MAG: T9SS type A sorting domain-containing protein, partial [Ignavibacteriaceae bacterium]|nr:T9SS type A sorting domain-containing protein [Ignavibacteriaceae bacterium]
TLRTFGRATAANLGFNEGIESFAGWTIRYSYGDMYHLGDPGVYLNKKESPIDFPVWLNPDDIANGYDTVVEEARGWMNNLVYGHNVITDKSYYIPDTDSIVLNAQLENPNSHPVSIVTYIKDLQGSLIDSVLLNPSGDPQSETWTGVWDTPIQENIFKLDITAKDLITSESFTLSNVSSFTTAGPVIVDSIYITYNSFVKAYYVKLFLKNEGNTFTILYSRVQLSSDDLWITSISSSQSLPDILPGSIVSSGNFYVRVDSTFPGQFNFNFLVSVEGWPCWKDSAQVIVTGIEDEIQVPLTFSLEQNYPNPFNPTTTIEYQIPEMSFVTLKIYDVLGSEVATLVNEEKSVGTYELNWNAANLPSGVYFYRIQAGSFIETKKMVLLK